jgi:hypothetical protein
MPNVSAENIMVRLEKAIAVGNHSEAARLAKEVSKVIFKLGVSGNLGMCMV